MRDFVSQLRRGIADAKERQALYERNLTAARQSLENETRLLKRLEAELKAEIDGAEAAE